MRRTSYYEESCHHQYFIRKIRANKNPGMKNWNDISPVKDHIWKKETSYPNSVNAISSVNIEI
jgi:hypothetical protein